MDWQPRIFMMADGGNGPGASTMGYGGRGGPGGPGYSAPSGHSGPSDWSQAASYAKDQAAQTVAEREAAKAAAAAAKQKANEDYARTQAGIATQGAARESAGYARAQGLNPAQAALMAGQTAGNTYGSAYGSNLYSKLGLDMQKYGIDKNYQAQKNQIDQQNQNNLFGGIGAGLSAAALLFSDENVKTDIKDGYGILERVASVVNPKTFKVKPEAGGTGETDTGILAQDLEKTPLASTVVDTPEGKMVDTRKLTTANTGMLSELSKKVDTLYSFLKEAAHGPARAS